ncbi:MULTISPECIES: uracil-DNA glycosylase [Enterococcaceae]|uniref:uracil-DNA glycosylase n=1 Tax=Enterococcaceae TaxID=81852 RepID=UPI000E4F063C|nr:MULTISPECIES: uracil-DNA glycosylase [Enterococcaceae]MCI0130385.1 uracil-DNA glycosylase [Vagococcus sp. CY53-2]RGI32115.1 uracil-DNA glycosylase [Melissococcus sp. OM08-11BH]UNM89820.1 uracil-DNA glycosylase [Vagococcus sp. CY52-2]
MLKDLIQTDWQDILHDELQTDYVKNLELFLEKEYQSKTIFPDKQNIFSALNYTPFSETKVVILGQDPYHGDNQAHGLSFSVLPGTKIPPSLVNIFKELADDCKINTPSSGYLVPWAKQGVLLLNTVLTVEKGKAHSHKNKGWENFTNCIIKSLNKKENPIIFVLWGKPAQQKKQLIDHTKHIIIEAPHPSPLSAYRGFFGSKPFSKINNSLKETNQPQINWTLS